MLHFFGACSKKDWYRIESGAWCKHQVVCGAWCMAQNNGTEFHLVSHRFRVSCIDALENETVMLC